MTNYSKTFRICIALDESFFNVSPITRANSVRYDFSADGIWWGDDKCQRLVQSDFLTRAIFKKIFGAPKSILFSLSREDSVRA